MKKSVLSLSVLLGLAVANANAATTDLTVTGTITPAACTPTLGNGGLVDYGVLSVPDLEEATTIYRLPAKNLNFSIDCSAPVLFALIANDNRRDSADTTNAALMGLGKHEDQNIGYFGMRWDEENTQVDGVRGYPLYSNDAGNSWQNVLTATLTDAGRAPNNRLSFSNTGGATPVPATNVNVIMDIIGGIYKALPINSAVPLDGSATIEVVYL